MLNEKYINPIKLEKIRKGINFIEKNNNGEIKKIILFGSSLTEDCSEQSDIDLCFVTDCSSADNSYFRMFGGLPLEMDEICDIVVYGKINGVLREEIDRKGIMIYEYKAD